VELKGSARARANAKRLRWEMSLPEVLLWQALRKGPGGHRFRHQVPAGDYTLDFYCAPARLVIEVDGEAHSRGDRPERDAVRDAWLAGHGVSVLRVRAQDVLRDLDAVVWHIVTGVTARVPLHHPPEEGGWSPSPALRGRI
jgi:very-short-patch-repair endonuclease